MKIKYKGKWYEVITIHELDGIKWYEIIKYEVPVVDYVQDKDIENIEGNYEKYRNRRAKLKSETEGLIREHDETTFKEKDDVYWELKCKLIKKIEEKLSEKDYGFDSGDAEHGYKSCLNDLLTWVNNIEWLND